MPTAIEMIEASLKFIGAQGLYNGSADCGCIIGDLMPCRAFSGACRAAWNDEDKAFEEGEPFWMRPYEK